jgi:hypothetical protein
MNIIYFVQFDKCWYMHIPHNYEKEHIGHSKCFLVLFIFSSFPPPDHLLHIGKCLPVFFHYKYLVISGNICKRIVLFLSAGNFLCGITHIFVCITRSFIVLKRIPLYGCTNIICSPVDRCLQNSFLLLRLLWIFLQMNFVSQ